MTQQMTDKTTKLCPQCNNKKHVDDFGIRIHPTGTQTIRSWCKVCDLAYHAKWKKDKRKELKKAMKSNNEKKALEKENLKTSENTSPPPIVKKKVIFKVQPQLDEKPKKEENTEDTPLQPQLDEKPKTQDKKTTETEREYNTKYYKENREELLEKGREYKKQNEEKVKAKKKEYYQKHKEENREKRKKYIREYYLANKEKIHEYLKKYLSENPVAKLRNTLKNRLLDYIYKQKFTDEYLGSPISLVKKWIESNFTNGMDWSNHGTLWELDHTIAISLFNLNNELDMFVCFNWMNLFPMSAKDNKSKYKNIELDLIKYRKDKLKAFCITNDLTTDYDSYIKLYDEYIEKFKK